ncbi:MAG: extracellular solute-binding protein, partial [Anaerolineales bacterium]
MKAKNRKNAIILGVLGFILFSACGVTNEILPTPTNPAPTIQQTEQQPSVEATELAPEEPIVADDQYQNIDPTGQMVAFWHPYSAENEAALQEIITDFNATNLWNIQVTAEYQGDHENIFNKMLTFMNTADVPALVVATPSQAATYQLAEGLIDLNELVYSEKWGLSQGEIDDFFPASFNQDILPATDNFRLGFPLNHSMNVLYYNQDWLSELGYDHLPATPQEFQEMACAAAAQPFSSATAEGNQGYPLNMDASLFASWTFAFGGDVFDEDRAQFSYDSPEAAQAMAFLQRLVLEGCASLVNEPNADRVEFSQGTALFTTGSSSSLNFYQSVVQAGSNHNWSVGPIPHTTQDPVQNIFGDSISIPKTSPETQLAAWLFLKYATNPEIQANWAIQSHNLPVRASAAEYLGDYFAANPAYASTFELLPFATTEPAAAGYKHVREMVAESMFAITQGADVASVLADLNANANTYLQEKQTSTPETPDPWSEIDPSGQTITFWHQQPAARHAVLDE